MPRARSRSRRGSCSALFRRSCCAPSSTTSANRSREVSARVGLSSTSERSSGSTWSKSGAPLAPGGRVSSLAEQRSADGRLFEAPLLRLLDQRARSELCASGATRTLRARRDALSRGDVADTFWVVLEGTVALHAPDGARGGARIVRRAQRFGTFGEEGERARGPAQLACARRDSRARVRSFDGRLPPGAHPTRSRVGARAGSARLSTSRSE